ncbi:hypothetical protein HUU59_11035 [bacterium]|nr:hypothetical protein [bacterium]
MTIPRIEFYMHLEALGYDRLAEGRVECYNSDGAGIILPATSGLIGFQSQANLWTPGKGPIPPHDKWTVSTTPEVRPDKGIEGDFFRIYPVELINPNNAADKRSGFGIHRDANIPGSAGCIVIADRLHFAEFTRFMLILAAKSVKSLPLEVNYR